MLFNSFLFWAFFALVLFLYGRLPHRGQNRMLLVASYVFYGAWDWRFLFLTALSTVVDYGVGRRLGRTEEPAARKRLVAVSATVNLGLLAIFKYFDFFFQEISIEN